MKICLVLIGRIGDLILSTPAFSALKQRYPNAQISAIISQGNGAVLHNNPYVDEVFEFTKNYSGLYRLFRFLRKNHFDYWIDQKDHYSATSRYLALFARANHKIGFEKADRKHCFAFDQTIPLRIHGKSHFTQKVANALQLVDVSLGSLPHELFSQLYLGSDAIAKAKAYFDSVASADNRKLKLLINLSASSSNRIYTYENWTRLFELVSFDKYNITLVSMPKEREIARQLRAKFPELHEHNTDSLEDFFATIHECDILISPDTSAVHVAAAFSKPTVALYGYDLDNLVSFAPLSDALGKTVFVLTPAKDSPLHLTNNINGITAQQILSSLNSICRSI